MTVVQIDVEETDKKKHSNSQDVKRDDEEEISVMKNNENDEYSKAIEVTDEKKSQILKCSTSCHADNHVIEKSDCCDDEHKNKQKHVVYVINIMFDETDNDDYLTNVVKR